MLSAMDLSSVISLLMKLSSLFVTEFMLMINFSTSFCIPDIFIIEKLTHDSHPAKASKAIPKTKSVDAGILYGTLGESTVVFVSVVTVVASCCFTGGTDDKPPLNANAQSKIYRPNTW